MKRAVSILLTLAMVLSMMTVFFVTNVAAATVISNTSPAITAIVGKSISLSGYSVTFDGDTYATSNVTWKNGDSEITTFTPSQKGVTKLTATSGSKTKTIYVVAKNAGDSEYVLYEANMADFASVDAIKNAGWTLPVNSTSNFSKASDGSLNIANSDKWSVTYAYLPQWLGEFGDYSFEINAKILSTVNNDTGRWLGVMHRAAGLDYNCNYSHIAIRDAANGSSGFEFGERYNSAFNIVSSASASYTTLKDAYRTFRLCGYGKTVSCEIENQQLIYISDFTDATQVTKVKQQYNPKGYLGIIMCGGELAVKSVKVTVQENAPEEVPSDTTLIYNNHHNADNLINPIANAQRVVPSGTSLSAEDLNGLSVAFFNAGDGDVTAAMKACVEAGVVPTIFVSSNAQADKVITAVNAAGVCDVNVLSSTASVLTYIRGKDSRIRTGLRLDISSQMADGEMTADEANAIRLQVRAIPATYIVVDSGHITRQAVSELQKLALAVWAVIPETCADYELEIVKCLTAGVNGIINKDADLVNQVIAEYFVENSLTRPALIIGHRGNPSCAPENTIESFQAAYDNGADIFELDVNRTSDGVIVVLHDDTLTRTTTYTGSTAITNMTWAEAKKYHVLDLNGNSTGKPIPTLAEVLTWAKGKDINIFIEFKYGVESSIAPTMQAVKDYGLTSQVDVISFMGSYCTKTQSAVSGMSTGLLMSTYNDTYGNITATSYGKALSQMDKHIEDAQTYKSTVNPGSYSNQFSHHSAQVIADRGMTMWPWTYGKDNTGSGFVQGFDGLTTDYVELVKDMPKIITASDFVMYAGQIYTCGSVTMETHGNAVSHIDAEYLIPTVVSGDSVAVENGRLVAKKEGISKVIFGYKAKTCDGQEYVLYSEPVTVTVDNDNANILKPLVALAKTMTVKDLSESDLISLRELFDTAVELLNTNSTDKTAIADTASDMSSILSDTYGKTVVDVDIKSYTAPEANYYKWDNEAGAPSTELHATYIDDGKRLADGIKGSAETDSKKYSVWQDIDVEIVVDLGSKVQSNIFNAYFAAGLWGVAPPKGMEISYKDAGGNWISVDTDVERVYTGGNSAGWNLYKYTATTNKTIEARYVKFTIKRDGLFVWMDEVEVQYASGSKVGGDYIYITEFNGRVNDGDAVIYTSTENANCQWTTNIIAEWDDLQQAYAVVSVTNGDGTDASIPTLKNGQILIAVHDWESGITNGSQVLGSATNAANAGAVEVGQILVPYGVDIANKSLGIAPYVRFIDPDHVCTDNGDDWKYDDDGHWKVCVCGEILNKDSHTPGAEADCVNPQKCKICDYVFEEALGHKAENDTWYSDASGHWHKCSCGEKVDVQPHDEGKWRIATPAKIGVEGEKELYCTVCEYIIDTETIPALEEDHVCSAVTDWYEDETSHWKLCACGDKVDVTAHEFNGAADCETDKVCLECGYVAEKAHGHKYEWVVTKESDIGVEGEKAYKCSVCGDVDKTEVIPALPDEDNDWMLGDVNMNDKIDMTDYILLKRAYFGTYDLNEEQEKRGDCNQNGKIDMTDYILLKRAYFGTYVLEKK